MDKKTAREADGKRLDAAYARMSGPEQQAEQGEDDILSQMKEHVQGMADCVAKFEAIQQKVEGGAPEEQVEGASQDTGSMAAQGMG